MRLKGFLFAVLLMAILLLISACARPNMIRTDDPGNDLLGMLVLDLFEEEAMSSYHVSVPGVYVMIVDEKAVAFQVGFRTGDRLLTLNGEPIPDSSALAPVYTSEGRYSFEIARENSEQIITCVLDTVGLMEGGDL